LRTDIRRGVVQRRLAWDDPQVNEEWNCDKGRFAFPYAQEGRLTTPLVRGEDGVLHAASWPEAIAAAAAGLAKARGGRAAVLAGGRHTAEDAYALSKFARGVLGTDDIDFRARPHSAEEAAFLAARVAGVGFGVTYADLESAAHVVLVAFEPEDESPIVQLRLRKAVRRGSTHVTAVTSHTTEGLYKLKASIVEAQPGAEVAALVHADIEENTVVLVGERAASVPGLLSALVELTDEVGAKLAWVPRRAGDRAAVDAGLLPGVLPGGRLVTDEGARNYVASVWGVDAGLMPTTAGRDFSGIVAAATADAYEAVLVTGFDVDDTSNPDATLAALQRAPFVVALEQRPTAVTALADVVLPVATVTEKSGTFINWEGRSRQFAQVLRENNSLTDARVLAMVADAMDALIGRQDVAQMREEIAALGGHTAPRAAAPVVQPVAVEGLTLSTWNQLIDNGSMQAGEPFLAATAREPLARMSEATAEAHGVHTGDSVVVSTSKGSISLTVQIVDAVDNTVWLPTNSEGSHVRVALQAAHGSAVTP
jgi:NADH-quinone oxidoreductase subunit G